MAKKMAVKTKSSSQKSFDLKMPSAGKSFFRFISVSLLIVGCGFLVMQGVDVWKNVWPVEKVLLQGETKYLKESQLADFVNAQDVKGMLAIDLNTMQAEANQLDWVQSVEVRKVWPDQLVFVVTEHQPVARVDDFILTQQGTKIRQDERLELFEDLPRISLQSPKEISVEHYMKVWQEFKLMKRQLELLSLELDSLKVDAVKNWHLDFSSGLQMNLGRKQRAERVERLVKVYSAIADRKNIKTIDLRYHNGVSVEWNEQQEKQKS